VEPVRASAIARFLALPLVRGDADVCRPDDISACGPGSVVWLRRHDPDAIAQINRLAPALVRCDAASAADLLAACVVSPNPRLSFLRVVQECFAEPGASGIHPTAVIDPAARLSVHVAVGAYARIGPEVTIGAGTVIGSGVAIEGPVTIGASCRIKPNAVLGAPGFGFERDEEGVPVHFPHVGTIEIGDDVWIGSCSTVERATLGVTAVLHGAKIDDHVQVGHNCRIEENTLVMANVVICGGAVIGPGCWIAPNSVVKEKVHIGAGVTIGLGSVVLRDVEPGSVMAGVPARRLR
jgi:UDP-3-O-[3-hydroxymyristoyl] glucosamine N-acyltransferase